ncbi:MAG TPA: DUF2269 family protein [Novosphingobium sp.]|nr:DUF2269 family protein [Novosphingobium sp.]
MTPTIIRGKCRARCTLGADYRRAMHLWFALGWPAFIGLTAVFWLMVAKPALW